MGDTVNAIERCCANIERTERELFQPRPCPDGLVFHADDLPHRPLSPSLFPSKCPLPFTQFQVSTQVLTLVLPTSWVQYSQHALTQHASTSPSSTLLLTRVCPRSIFTPLPSGPTFSAAAVYQVCCRRHGCRGKPFFFLEMPRHQSMLLAGFQCQHRRVRALIDVMKGRLMREPYSQHGE